MFEVLEKCRSKLFNQFCFGGFASGVSGLVMLFSEHYFVKFKFATLTVIRLPECM